MNHVYIQLLNSNKNDILLPYVNETIQKLYFTISLMKVDKLRRDKCKIAKAKYKTIPGQSINRVNIKSDKRRASGVHGRCKAASTLTDGEFTDSYYVTAFNNELKQRR